MAGAQPQQRRRCRFPALLASVFATVLLLFSPAAGAVEKGANRSSLLGQPRQWATGKDEGEILAEAEARGRGGEDSEAGEQGREFESLDGMLQWAIGNSDPDKLREKAEEIESLSADELLKRQLEIKELMEKLRMPSDAELMKIAIADLNNSSASLEDRKRALQELFVLVEPIDNANDLEKLGGLIPLIQELNNADEGIRTTSAWVLGKASQNNALVQNQILRYGALERLVKMGYSSSEAEAAKALYAISSLIRDNEHGQHILSTASNSVRLQRKVVSLLAYVADFQLSAGKSHAPFLSNHHFIRSVVHMISAPDLDLQEKALLAVRSLLQLTSDDAAGLHMFSGLDDSLEALRMQLNELTSNVDRREYALEVEVLRKEVQIMFQQKFNEPCSSSTSDE
ncbi:unnamed protein product [Urochloa decumbens]|uniref:Nucleotide exchange factor Fes1 domain-containing protein n=1 Tax=Urochloa decumbens TaxID=240449 RepID=A0ABC9FIF8_9POAL